MSAFRPLLQASARWRPVEGEGLEHITVAATREGFAATGTLIGAQDGVAFGAWYNILLDAAWRVRAFSVNTTDGRWFVCRSPEPGRWTDGDGRTLPKFDGCIDIDLSGTPFTNTLPIRRLGLAAGQSAELAVLWVPLSTFEAFVDGQRYTCREPGRRYLYEATDGSFEAELTVDEDGLVSDYPGLFRRA